MMITGNNWKSPNIPRLHKEFGGSPFSILPVLECLLEINEDNITDLLPSADFYSWGDNMTNIWAWTNNAYKVVYFTPDLSRYGCIPDWFPNTDQQGRLLTDQKRIDRFLYLLDQAYGGLPDNHKDVNPRKFGSGDIGIA